MKIIGIKMAEKYDTMELRSRVLYVVNKLMLEDRKALLRLYNVERRYVYSNDALWQRDIFRLNYTNYRNLKREDPLGIVAVSMNGDYIGSIEISE